MINLKLTLPISPSLSKGRVGMGSGVYNFLKPSPASHLQRERFIAWRSLRDYQSYLYIFHPIIYVFSCHFNL